MGCPELHVAPPNKRGRPKTHSTHEILNAIFFYLLRSGFKLGGYFPATQNALEVRLPVV
jgi:hypothetical protein